jgi:hypothetical protein
MKVLLDALARKRKAILAALVAGLTAAGAALEDNSLSSQESIWVALAVLGVGGGTYAVKNRPPQEGD